jgi:hypothetical protein
MRIVLIDNGSVEAASHEALRAVAEAISAEVHARVDAVSWRHSNRIPPGSLRDGPAWVLAPWMRAQLAAGERRFLFIPFFISPQGAIGSSLRQDIEELREDAGSFEFAFTDGLSAGAALPAIVSERVRLAAEAARLERPRVVVVDHGGPSRASAAVRDQVAAAVREELGGSASAVRAASMESPKGPGFEFNRPLLSEALVEPGWDAGDVLIAPLFLLPGRHAGPGGDLAAIAREAERRSPELRCHFAELVGTHPLVVETLAGALRRMLPASAQL